LKFIRDSFNHSINRTDILPVNLKKGLKYKNKWPYTCLELLPPGVTLTVSSNQAPLRHMETFIYRCFLPDLTGFIKLHCVRPNRQHHLSRPDPKRNNPQHGIDPAIAGCRLQGTATTPSSTAKLLNYIKLIPCIRQNKYY